MVHSIALALIAMFSVLAAVPVASAQQSAPNLVGTWSGKVEAGVRLGDPGHEPAQSKPAFGNFEMTFSLKVVTQQGRGLIGTWSSSNSSETILGVIRRDNQTVLLIDEDSYFQARLLSPTSMELCLEETHVGSMGVWCLLMNKE